MLLLVLVLVLNMNTQTAIFLFQVHIDLDSWRQFFLKRKEAKILFSSQVAEFEFWICN